MERQMFDRLFAEIDSNTTRIEKISKIVYSHATMLNIVSKLLMLVITFLVIGSLTMFVDFGKQHPVSMKPSNHVEKEVGSG